MKGANEKYEATRSEPPIRIEANPDPLAARARSSGSSAGEGSALPARMATDPWSSRAAIDSVGLRSIESAKDSTAARAAASMSGLPACPLSARRLHCPSAYFSSSEALNDRN